MVQIGSQEAVTGRNIGYTFNLNVNVLFCIHYGVKKAVKNWNSNVLWSWTNVLIHIN